MTIDHKNAEDKKGKQLKQDDIIWLANLFEAAENAYHQLNKSIFKSKGHASKFSNMKDRVNTLWNTMENSMEKMTPEQKSAKIFETMTVHVENHIFKQESKYSWSIFPRTNLKKPQEVVASITSKLARSPKDHCFTRLSIAVLKKVYARLDLDQNEHNKHAFARYFNEPLSNADLRVENALVDEQNKLKNPVEKNLNKIRDAFLTRINNKIMLSEEGIEEYLSPNKTVIWSDAKARRELAKEIKRRVLYTYTKVDNIPKNSLSTKAILDCMNELQAYVGQAQNLYTIDKKHYGSSKKLENIFSNIFEEIHRMQQNMVLIGNSEVTNQPPQAAPKLP